MQYRLCSIAYSGADATAVDPGMLGASVTQQCVTDILSSFLNTSLLGFKPKSRVSTSNSQVCSSLVTASQSNTILHYQQVLMKSPSKIICMCLRFTKFTKIEVFEKNKLSKKIYYGSIDSRFPFDDFVVDDVANDVSEWIYLTIFYGWRS